MNEYTITRKKERKRNPKRWYRARQIIIVPISRNLIVYKWFSFSLFFSDLPERILSHSFSFNVYIPTNLFVFLLLVCSIELLFSLSCTIVVTYIQRYFVLFCNIYIHTCRLLIYIHVESNKLQVLQ